MNHINDKFPDNQLIGFGDTCVIYISENLKSIFKVEHNAAVQTKFGQIKAEDLVNHPYGVRYDCRKGWILPLRLTPELWTQLLPHRTQVLYQADISMILLQLDIKPGSVVVESGTGSGSLSHAILRACLPTGFLHTYDINESRVNEAAREFAEHGFGADRVKVTNRDVCELGFSDELKNKVDACILDLPRTWDAIEHAYKVLKSDGSRLCTFSPCIEQVQQNVAKMTELKMKDIVTLECLIRPYRIKVQHMRVWTDEVLDGLLEMEKKRYEFLEKNLGTSTKDTTHSSNKRMKLETCDDVETKAIGTNQEPPLPKSGIILDQDNYKYDDIESLTKALSDPKAPFSANLLPRKPTLSRQSTEKPSVSHSGFLTFASKRL